MNQQKFFDTVRGRIFGGTLKQSQVDGLILFLNAFDLLKLDKKFAAYILATVAWETGRTFQPVKEGFKASDEWRKKNLRYYPWYGRGYVQLTWETNYRKATQWFDTKFGLKKDFVADKELALDPTLSLIITIAGMLEGWFTGKKLSDFGTLNYDYEAARKIVNGNDKKVEIALMAYDFEQGLVDAGYTGKDREPDLALLKTLLVKPVAAPKPASKKIPRDLIAGLLGLGAVAYVAFKALT